MEESAGFGAVELRGSQIGLFRQVVNCIDESRRLAPESRGVGDDIRGSRSTLEQVGSIIGKGSAVSQVLRTQHDDSEKKRNIMRKEGLSRAYSNVSMAVVIIMARWDGMG